MTPRKRTYSIAEVAELLGVCWLTVRRWIDSGELATCRRLTGRTGKPLRVYRIPESEVERLTGVAAG